MPQPERGPLSNFICLPCTCAGIRLEHAESWDGPPYAPVPNMGLSRHDNDGYTALPIVPVVPSRQKSRQTQAPSAADSPISQQLELGRDCTHMPLFLL